MTKNLQLTGKQQALSKVIVEGGNETEISFARKTVDYVKLRDLSDEDFSIGISMLLTKIINLLGIKEALSDINKNDIIELLDNNFKTISLQEINYAFKLERYNQLEPKTEHYQLFNAEYVSFVLIKYKKWLQRIRRENNLSMSKKQAMPEITQEEKDNLIYHGVVTCFDHYIQFREVIDGKVWVHDHLDELGLIKLTAQEKKALWDKALVNCKNHAKSNNDPLKAKTMLLELENKNSSPRINEYKKLRMYKTFDVLEAKGKHIKDVL